jgi:hypothetical protein
MSSNESQSRDVQSLETYITGDKLENDDEPHPHRNDVVHVLLSTAESDLYSPNNDAVNENDLAQNLWEAVLKEAKDVIRQRAGSDSKTLAGVPLTECTIYISCLHWSVRDLLAEAFAGTPLGDADAADQPTVRITNAELKEFYKSVNHGSVINKAKELNAIASLEEDGEDVAYAGELDDSNLTGDSGFAGLGSQIQALKEQNDDVDEELLEARIDLIKRCARDDTIEQLMLDKYSADEYDVPDSVDDSTNAKWSDLYYPYEIDAAVICNDGNQEQPEITGHTTAQADYLAIDRNPVVLGAISGNPVLTKAVTHDLTHADLNQSSSENSPEINADAAAD